MHDNKTENPANHVDVGTEPDTIGCSVNTKNIEELPNVVQEKDSARNHIDIEPGQMASTDPSAQNSTESVVNTLNVGNIDENTEQTDAVNTENEPDGDICVLTRNPEGADTDTVTNLSNKKERDENHSELPESETAMRDNMHNTNESQSSPSPNSKKLRDAVDGLLLLSSGEETMDELALSQDEDDTVEFNQELDMEDMMTALHIDSTNKKEDANKEQSYKNSEQSTESTKGRNRTSPTRSSNKPTPMEQPNVSVNTNNIIDNSSSQSNSGRGQIKIRSITLKRHKGQSRNYYCSNCNDNVPHKGLQALNIHHRESHDPVQCGVCNKWCSTPESLRRHSYDHANKTEICSVCGETFHFKSELKTHLITHDEREGIHQCMKGGCGKRYMRKGELVAHVKTHTGKLWKCTWKGCTYEAIDKRYLYQHKKCHSKNNYICKYCKEGFIHYMQRKRHYEKSHSR